MNRLTTNSSLAASVVVVILVLAGVLQLWALGSKSLWIDEVVTVRIAGSESVDDVFTAYQRTERQPPLHYLILHFWIQGAGDTDASVRVPSALFSVASVGLMFWLGYRVAGRSAGLIASYLLAISPFLLLFGRMARYFSLSLFTVLLATALLVEAIRAWNERRAGLMWLLYAVASFLMLLSNYVNLAVLLAQGFFVLVAFAKERRVLRSWLASAAAVAVGFGYWVVVVDELRIVEFGAPAESFNISGWKGVALMSVYPFYAFALGETIFPWEAGAGVAIVALAVSGWLGLKRVRDPHLLGWLGPIGLSATLVVSIIGFVAVVRDLQFEQLPSRAIGALPFVILIVAVGIAAMRKSGQILVLSVVTIASAVGMSNYFSGSHFHNPVYTAPTREIAAGLQSEIGPNDLVVADRDLALDYYWLDSRRPILSTANPEGVKLLIEHGYPFRRVWLVVFGRDGTRAAYPAELERWLGEHLRLADERGYVMQDPTFSRLKEVVQGFEDYKFKVTVKVFEQPKRDTAPI